MIRKTIILSLLTGFTAAFLQSCGPQVPKAEESCGFAQNSYGERLSLKEEIPLSIYIHTSVPVEYRETMRRSIEQWQRSSGRNLLRYGGEISQGSRPKKDGVSVIYWLNEWEAGKSSEQARTLTYYVGNRIEEADIKVNAKDFQYYDSNHINYEAVHLPSLMIHELGHVVGLGHSDENPDYQGVMETYLSKGRIRTELSLQDLEALSCEY